MELGICLSRCKFCGHCLCRVNSLELYRHFAGRLLSDYAMGHVAVPDSMRDLMVWDLKRRSAET